MGEERHTSSLPHPTHSNVMFLPVLHMNPNDYTCIYSTLIFLMEQAHKLGIDTPIVTFDQPLWLKAFEIVKSKSLKIVLILGGFHLLMNFLGSIGYIMGGSGLSDA